MMTLAEFFKKMNITEKDFSGLFHFQSCYEGTNTPYCFLAFKREFQNSDDEQSEPQDRMFMSKGLAEEVLAASSDAECSDILKNADVVYSDEYHNYGLRRAVKQTEIRKVSLFL